MSSRRIVQGYPRLTGDYRRDRTAIEDILRQLIDATDDGLPVKHAVQHLTAVGAAKRDADGPQDGLISTAMPTPISLDGEGDPGDPPEGASSAGHVHPASPSLRALGTVTTELVQGKRVAMVRDATLLSVLEQILVLVDRLVDLRGR